MIPKLRLIAVIAAASVAAGSLLAASKKKKKDEEPATQTLEIPKDPPQAVVAEASRLVFHVSSLSAKGLLSQQIRDALRDLQRQIQVRRSPSGGRRSPP